MRTTIAVCLWLLSSTVSADDTRRYSVIFAGENGGEQSTTTGSAGRIDVSLHYRSNGRGPTLEEEIELAEDGTFASYRVNGTSTFGAPVDETFSRRGNQIEWRSHSDRGETSVSGPAIYVPVESSFEVSALIARAVARAPGGRMAALPDGEIESRKLTDATLESDGQSIDIALYAVSGLRSEPTLVWLTDDEEQRFFSFIYPGWFRVIEAGWQEQGGKLEALQVDAEVALLEDLARRLAHRFEDPILFRDVRIFDSENARLLEPADVYVHDGRIAAIYEPGSMPRDDVVEIDGSGRVLSPALFDMHAHESAWNAVLQIAGGVTTIRDMGNIYATIAPLRSRIERGESVGPRVLLAGFIEGKSEFSASSDFVVEDLEAAKDAIDWYAQRGFRMIKLYNSFRPEWVAPAAAYAHERGLRVSGHVPAFMRAEEAVRAGYDELVHINQVMLNFLVGPDDDMRTLARFYLMNDHARDIDLDSVEVKDFVQLLVEHGTVIDTTLATFEAMFLQRQGEMNPSYAAVAAHLPVGDQRSRRTNSMDVNDENAARWRSSWTRALEFVHLMHEAGIPFVAGTDEVAGFTLHRELELYVQAGLTPAEALRIATWNGAKFSGLLAELGSIERGKSADLILIDGDPTRDISAIRRISLVMKEGVVYLPAEVYEAVAVRRFVDPPDIRVFTDGG